MNLLIMEFPEPLQRELKSKAAKEGVTVREAVIRAAEQWVGHRTRQKEERRRKKP